MVERYLFSPDHRGKKSTFWEKKYKLFVVVLLCIVYAGFLYAYERLYIYFTLLLFLFLRFSCPKSCIVILFFFSCFFFFLLFPFLSDSINYFCIACSIFFQCNKMHVHAGKKLTHAIPQWQ